MYKLAFHLDVDASKPNILYVYQSALQGVGNTFMTMVSGGLEFVIRVVGSAIVTVTGVAYGIFLAEVAAWFGAAGFLTLSFYSCFNRIKKQADSV